MVEATYGHVMFTE